MRELSIFIDESGDFGNYQNYCPFYIVSLVFHNQNNSISNQIQILNNFLNEIGMENHTIHSAPLIRQEQSYKFTDIKIRNKVFKQLFNFVRSVDISYRTFVINKKIYPSQIEIIQNLTLELSSFLKDNYKYFSEFDKIYIYYDNGQIELSKTLVAIFSAILGNSVEFRKISPNNYKLFQAADLICTLSLINNKLLSGKKLTNSEQIFFGSERKLRKNYLKFFKK